MQKVFNLFSELFLFIRYRNKKDAFRLFQKIIQKSDKVNFPYNKESKTKTLILAPYRVSPSSNLFEGLIGYFYKLKGYKVQAIMCDQAVKYCDNITHADEKKRLAICSLCLREQKRFSSIFGIESLSLKDNVSKKEKEEINDFISSSNIQSVDDLVINGVDFRKVVESAITRYTLKSEIDYVEESDLVKGFVKTALTTYKGTENILVKNECSKMILSHGVYSTWGTVLKVAQMNHIPSYVWARGYVGKGNLLFGHDKSYLEDVITESKHLYLDYNYSKSEMEESLKYFSSKRNKNSKLEYINYYENIDDKSDTKTDFFTKELKAYTSVFGMFTNIPWDGQIYNQNQGFPNTASYLKSVISWFILNKDCALVIRAHPAEMDGREGRGSEKFFDVLNRYYPQLPDNVYYLAPDNPISSYDLSMHIDAAIIYGSSMGIELAIAGIPVIQAGRFNTTLKGIVFEPQDTLQMHAFFEKAKIKELNMSEEQINNAICFGYYWIFKRHIEDDTVILDKLIFDGYGFDTIKELYNNKTLNFIYDKIENKQRIVN